MKKPPVPKTVESFSASFGSIWQAFQKLGEECHGAGPLDERARRLVKIGIAAASQSEGQCTPRSAMREQVGFQRMKYVMQFS